MKFQSKLQRVRESDDYGKCDIVIIVREQTNETNQRKPRVTDAGEKQPYKSEAKEGQEVNGVNTADSPYGKKSN